MLKKGNKKAWLSLLSAIAVAVSLTVPTFAEEAVSPECEIRIVHTNDIHGYYTATDYGTIGFAYLKALVEEQDADLVLDIGDTFHGQSFATAEKGIGIAELMKEIGYDAMTPGNHDWSYGAQQLKTLEGVAGFPILASNVITDSGKGYFDTPYVVKEVTADDGTQLKIGIIGVIDDVLFNSTASENVAGLSFEEESKIAAAQAEALRTKENCDLVIAMTHQEDCKGFIGGISGIDAVIAGHQHILIDESYTDAVGESVPLVEAGYYFYTVGLLELSIDPKTKKIVDTTETAYDAESIAALTPNEDVNEKISDIEEKQAAVLDSKIGHSENEYLYSWEEIRVAEQEISRLVTAAYIDKTGADLAIENAGGIRSGIPKGDITYRDIISISPYGNVLVTKELTGQQILDIIEKSLDISYRCNEVYTLQKQAIEKGEDPYQYEWPTDSGSALQFGGIYVEYDMEKEYGHRVIQASIGDAPIETDTLYTVATNNYMAESGDFDALAKAELLKEYGTCEEALRLFFETDSFEEAASKANMSAITSEESNTDSDKQEEAPKTGDNSTPSLLVLSAVSLGAMLLMFVTRKKREE